MLRRPEKERQTLDHRSPECFWYGKKPDQYIDMWSVGVVVSYMCGNPFCSVSEGEHKRLVHHWVAQLGTPTADVYTGYPAWARDGDILRTKQTDAVPWPPVMATALGGSGQQLVSALLSFTPGNRPSASEVLEHPFMIPESFPLMCVPGPVGGPRPVVVLDNTEGLGRFEDPCRIPFYPKTDGIVGQTLLAGERHIWGMRCKEVARENLSYILGDDVFLEGSDANKLLVDLANGREETKGDNPVLRCVINGAKTRIGGHMGTKGGVSLIGVCTQHPCIIARVIDFRAAFLNANLPWLLAMQAKCKRAVSRLGPKRRGENGNHFLKASLYSWFLGSGEVTLTEAEDVRGECLEEDHHMDGSMSIFHAGLTLGGNRDLFLNVEGFGRVRVHNTPGTFYMGNLTGPRHQVIHQRCRDHDLVDVPGLGRRSITIMLRTGLFPYHRSRYMDQIPKPKSLWVCIKNCMVEAMQTPGLRLPTLEEVKQQTHLRQHGGVRPASSSKRRRINGKTFKAFEE